MEAFIAHQITLVDKEKKLEVKENADLLSAYAPVQLQKRGVALIGLKVTGKRFTVFLWYHCSCFTNFTLQCFSLGMRTGLGGKSLIELELANPMTDPPTLPAHKIHTGDIVGLEEHVSSKQTGAKKPAPPQTGSQPKINGVVFRVTETRVTIALDEEVPTEIQDRCRIVKLANNVTYERMQYALKNIQSQIKSGDVSSVSQPLLRVLFDLQKPSFRQSQTEPEFFDATLNESQRDAVRFALSAEEVALIHGPPDWQDIHAGRDCTAASQGWQARTRMRAIQHLDNLVERLSRHRLDLIRMGHPARILPSVLDHSLDVVTRTGEGGQIVADIRRDMDQKLSSIAKSKSRADRRTLYGELKELRKEFKVREKKVVEDVVRASKVVVATLNGCGNKNMYKEEFDVVVIDEATQAVEAECWIAILKGKKVILAGDHFQLPPTVKSQILIPPTLVALSRAQALSPSHITLSTTLFDRLLSLYGTTIKRMLTTQYRMHASIMSFPSTELYESRLIADPSVAGRLLCHMDGVEETDDTSAPVVFVDTIGAGLEETKDEEEEATWKGTGGLESESKGNEGEVTIVVKHLEALVAAGVREEDVGVITPYTAQVSLLIKAIRERWPGVEVGSVDGFQGREKEAIIVSLVRSNSDCEVGFLAERRRLNVAMTRPKRHLCIVGDSETIGGRGGKGGAGGRSGKGGAGDRGGKGGANGDGGKDSVDKKKDKAGDKGAKLVKGKATTSKNNRGADGGFLARWMDWLSNEAEVRYEEYL
ncbi:AAA domain-containing protein [Jimgerdemannia flammicorona]|uniref:DNA helicase n=1 Tax=Jimgerdemannia flammicorona TaxID=994334 RepID=A0A433DM40_9FUNG|nr:AAA domain-containing protein [Jimgerdemannia flammicorona]